MTDKAKAAVTAAAVTPGVIVFKVILSPDDRALVERIAKALEACEPHFKTLSTKLLNAGGEP